MDENPCLFPASRFGQCNRFAIVKIVAINELAYSGDAMSDLFDVRKEIMLITGASQQSSGAGVE
jgi:hypothetical protein